MELEILINEDIKQAMLSKDKDKLEALRAIKAALLLEKTGKDVSCGIIPKTVELKMLQRLVKQRRESAEIFKAQDRPDLAEAELFQAGIIEKYLPAQMSEAEVEALVIKVIDEMQATGMKDMGKVIGVSSKVVAGKADNKLIADIVKKLLSN